MKKILFTVLFLTTALLARAQDELAIQQAVTAMFQAIAERNTEGIKQHCTADIKILESGAVWNIDTLLQKVGQITSADFKRVNTIDFMYTEIKGNTAWTTFNNRADIINNGIEVVVKWLETAILVRDGRSWKMKLLHSTLIERIKK